MVRKLCLLALVGALLVVPASAHAYLPPGFIGVSPQNPAGEKDFDLMAEAGIDSVRLPMFWAGIEAEEPSVHKPNWEGFDQEVELAAEAGIRVFPFVWSSPAWLTDEVIVMPVHDPRQRAAWAHFLSLAVHRYGPFGSFWVAHPKLPYLPIRSWEIWNEENLVTYSTEPSPADYAKLIRIAGRVLHRGDAAAQVIIGGFFGRPLQIPPNIGSGTFLEGVYDAGNVKPYFDGVALHPYVADAKAMGNQMNNLRRIMDAHRDRSAALYVTELGWGSRSGPTRWERGLRGQANELSKSFEMLSANRTRWNVRGAWWFTWTDEGGTCQFCGSAGLLTEKREAKPSWYRFTAWTGGDPDIVPRAHFGPQVEEAEEGSESGEAGAGAG
jgi:hypothetical protein